MCFGRIFSKDLLRLSDKELLNTCFAQADAITLLSAVEIAVTVREKDLKKKTYLPDFSFNNIFKLKGKGQKWGFIFSVRKRKRSRGYEGVDCMTAFFDSEPERDSILQELIQRFGNLTEVKATLCPTKKRRR